MHHHVAETSETGVQQMPTQTGQKDCRLLDNIRKSHVKDDNEPNKRGKITWSLTEYKYLIQIIVYLILMSNDWTFTRHLCLNTDLYERFVDFLNETFVNDPNVELGGMPRTPAEKKALMFLWYMANTNSFREISSLMYTSQSSAHRVIASILGVISRLSKRYIRRPNALQKARSCRSFCHTSGGIPNIIGAIDGCHIKITRPR